MMDSNSDPSFLPLLYGGELGSSSSLPWTSHPHTSQHTPQSQSQHTSQSRHTSGPALEDDLLERYYVASGSELQHQHQHQHQQHQHQQHQPQHQPHHPSHQSSHQPSRNGASHTHSQQPPPPPPQPQQPQYIPPPQSQFHYSQQQQQQQQQSQTYSPFPQGQYGDTDSIMSMLQQVIQQHTHPLTTWPTTLPVPGMHNMSSSWNMDPSLSQPMFTPSQADPQMAPQSQSQPRSSYSLSNSNSNSHSQSQSQSLSQHSNSNSHSHSRSHSQSLKAEPSVKIEPISTPSNKRKHEQSSEISTDTSKPKSSTSKSKSKPKIEIKSEIDTSISPSPSPSPSTSTSTSAALVPSRVLIPAVEDLSVIKSALFVGKRTRRVLSRLKPEERQDKKRTKHREADCDRRTKMTKLLDILDRMTGAAQQQGVISIQGDDGDEEEEPNASASRRTRNGILAASIQLLSKLARDVDELKDQLQTGRSPSVSRRSSPSSSSSSSSEELIINRVAPMSYLSPSIMFDSATAITIVDLEGRCLDANHKYTSLFGWSREALLGNAICVNSIKIMRLVWGSDYGRMVARGEEIRIQKNQQQHNLVTLHERGESAPEILPVPESNIVHPSVHMYPHMSRDSHIFPSTVSSIKDLLDGKVDTATCHFQSIAGSGKPNEYDATIWFTFDHIGNEKIPRYIVCLYPQDRYTVME